MYKILSRFVATLATALSVAFLGLIFVPQLAATLNVDLTSSALVVASILAMLILIHPFLARRAFVEAIHRASQPNKMRP